MSSYSNSASESISALNGSISLEGGVSRSGSSILVYGEWDGTVRNPGVGDREAAITVTPSGGYPDGWGDVVGDIQDTLGSAEFIADRVLSDYNVSGSPGDLLDDIAAVGQIHSSDLFGSSLPGSSVEPSNGSEAFSFEPVVLPYFDIPGEIEEQLDRLSGGVSLPTSPDDYGEFSPSSPPVLTFDMEYSSAIRDYLRDTPSPSVELEPGLVFEFEEIDLSEYVTAIGCLDMEDLPGPPSSINLLDPPIGTPLGLGLSAVSTCPGTDAQFRLDITEPDGDLIVSETYPSRGRYESLSEGESFGPASISGFGLSPEDLVENVDDPPSQITLELELVTGDGVVEWEWSDTVGVETPGDALFEIIDTILPSPPEPGELFDVGVVVENVGESPDEVEISLNGSRIDSATLSPGGTERFTTSETIPEPGEETFTFRAGPDSETITVGVGDIIPDDPIFNLIDIPSTLERPGDISSLTIPVTVENEGGDGVLILTGPSGGEEFEMSGGGAEETFDYELDGSDLPAPGETESVRIGIEYADGDEETFRTIGVSHEDAGEPAPEIGDLVLAADSGDISGREQSRSSYRIRLLYDDYDIETGELTVEGRIQHTGGQYPFQSFNHPVVHRNRLYIDGEPVEMVDNEPSSNSEDRIYFDTVELAPGSSIEYRYGPTVSDLDDIDYDQPIGYPNYLSAQGSVPEIPRLVIDDPPELTDEPPYPGEEFDLSIPVRNFSPVEGSINIYVDGELVADAVPIPGGGDDSGSSTEVRSVQFPATAPTGDPAPFSRQVTIEAVGIEAPGAENADGPYSLTLFEEFIEFDMRSPLPDFDVEEISLPVESPFPGDPFEIGAVVRNTSDFDGPVDVYVGGDVVATDALVPAGQSREFGTVLFAEAESATQQIEVVNVETGETVFNEDRSVGVAVLESGDVDLDIPDSLSAPVGEEPDIIASVTNVGGTPGEVELRTDEYDAQGSRSVYSDDAVLSPGESLDVPVVTYPDSGGAVLTHEVEAVSPHTGTLADGEFDLTPELPEFSIEGITTDPSPPQANEPFDLAVSVSNSGDADGSVIVEVGGEEVTTERTVAQGETETLSATLPAPGIDGQYSVAVRNVESGEIAADQSFEFSPLRPEFDFVEAVTTPETPASFSDFDLGITVENNGDAPGPLTLTVAGVEITSGDTLANGEQATYTHNLSAPGTDTTFSVEVVDGLSGDVVFEGDVDVDVTTPEFDIDNIRTPPSVVAPFDDVEIGLVVANITEVPGEVRVDIAGETVGDALEIPPAVPQAVSSRIQVPNEDVNYTVRVQNLATGEMVLEDTVGIDVERPVPEFEVRNIDLPPRPPTGDRFEITFEVANISEYEGDVTINAGDDTIAVSETISPRQTRRFTSRFDADLFDGDLPVVIENITTGEAVFDSVVNVSEEYESDGGDGGPYDGVFSPLDPLGVFGTTRQLPRLNDLLSR